MAESAVTVTPKKRQRSDSVITYEGPHGVDTIFRLLPRESRSAIKRMMAIEPTQRCTLSDLLRGKGRADGILCGCQGTKSGETLTIAAGHGCGDHECLNAEGADDGDDWLKGLVPCSDADHTPSHVHVKIPLEEKHKKRFF